MCAWRCDSTHKNSGQRFAIRDLHHGAATGGWTGFRIRIRQAGPQVCSAPEIE
jgi:hypothetical protein